MVRLLMLLCAFQVAAQSERKSDKNGTKPLRFEKKMIAAESYESVGVFDVNNDKILDIVSGEFWYEGPEYLKKHNIGGPKRFGEYYDYFSTIPLDVNGDGLMDVVTGGWFGKQLVWKENTGTDDVWPEHLIAETGGIETSRAWDIDGDGILEIVPNTLLDPLFIFRLETDADGKGIGRFEAIKVWEAPSHGLGFGDINGDGRGDLVIRNGWLEAPEKPFEQPWTFHPEFQMGEMSIPIVVTDLNSDGLNDFIAGEAHDYGLDWYEQTKSGKETTWIKHSIDPYNSQYHTLEWEDLDNDGKKELITGKRYRAHKGNGPGTNDPLGLYYFKWDGESFSKQFIDYGPLGVGKGTGIYFSIADLNEDGNKDIIVAGKDGLYVYYNLGGE